MALHSSPVCCSPEAGVVGIDTFMCIAYSQDTFMCIACSQDSTLYKKRKTKGLKKIRWHMLFPSIFSTARWTIITLVRSLTTKDELFSLSPHYEMSSKGFGMDSLHLSSADSPAVACPVPFLHGNYRDTVSPLTVPVPQCHESPVTQHHQLLLRTMLGGLNCLHHPEGLLRHRERFFPHAPSVAAALKVLPKCMYSSHKTGRTLPKCLALDGCFCSQTSASWLDPF